MNQHVVQIPTFGNNVVASRINKLLEKNPGWRLATVHPLQVEKVGGPEHYALAVFETVDASAPAEFND